jgi:hypothetical protein
MVRSIQKPLVGKVARYEGVYRPHWEIGHIAVRVSRVRKLFSVAAGTMVLLAFFWLEFGGWVETLIMLGGLCLVAATPSEERWAPRFPPNFEGTLDDGDTPIEFEGVVTVPGWYGHKGIMRRSVEIVRVLRYTPRRTAKGPLTRSSSSP